MKCWRCSGFETRFHRFRTPDGQEVHICTSCDIEFRVWCNAEAVVRAPSDKALQKMLKGTESASERLARRTEETEEKKLRKCGRPPGKKSEGETHEQKLARLRLKWGTPVTRADAIEDEMYVQDFGDG